MTNPNSKCPHNGDGSDTRELLRSGQRTAPKRGVAAVGSPMAPPARAPKKPEMAVAALEDVNLVSQESVTYSDQALTRYGACACYNRAEL